MESRSTRGTFRCCLGPSWDILSVCCKGRRRQRRLLGLSVGRLLSLLVFITPES